MGKHKLGMVFISSLVLVSLLLIGSYISEAHNRNSMVGQVCFSTESNAVIGLVMYANRGMEKRVSYQIPPLTGDSPYTFCAPFALSIIPAEFDNEVSSMGPMNRNSQGNHMGNTKGNADVRHMDEGETEPETMMDDEEDSGHMRGIFAPMKWLYDTYITLGNTSGDTIHVDATFYGSNGNVLKETDFDLDPHQTIQKSLFRLFDLR